jgi:hypothetical protein
VHQLPQIVHTRQAPSPSRFPTRLATILTTTLDGLSVGQHLLHAAYGRFGQLSAISYSGDGRIGVLFGTGTSTMA